VKSAKKALSSYQNIHYRTQDIKSWPKARWEIEQSRIS
jgi:hypothetical protein